MSAFAISWGTHPSRERRRAPSPRLLPPAEGVGGAAGVWYAKIAKLPYHLDLDKLRALSDGPVVVNPPEGYATTLDKLTAHRTLRRHSLPAADDFAFDVPFVSGTALFGEIKYRLEPADWLGVTVIGGRAVYGYRKQPQIFREGWRVFDSSGVGGHVDYVPLTAPLRQLAERAAAALGMAIVGFDLVRTADGWRIIDENAFPGLYRHCFTGAATTLEAELYRIVCQAAGAAAGRRT